MGSKTGVLFFSFIPAPLHLYPKSLLLPPHLKDVLIVMLDRDAGGSV